MTLNEDCLGLTLRLLDEICTCTRCTWCSSRATVKCRDLQQNKTFSDLLLWMTDLCDLIANWWMWLAEHLNKNAMFA